MENILFISSNYPSAEAPHRGTFVRNIVRAFADNGYNCVVIAPVKNGEKESEEVDITTNGNRIRVIHPIYRSYSNKKILNFNTYNLTIKSFEKAVLNGLKNVQYNFDIVYAHFLYPSGLVAVKLANKLKVPSYVAVGESGENLEKSINARGLQKSKEDFEKVTGIIAVSKLNADFCEQMLTISKTKIEIFPNGIEPKIFFPESKKAMREKYNFPKESHILSFLGHFNERKGPHRVLEAVEGLKDVKVIFIGEGDKELNSENILFKGKANQETIRELFSASDIFVLPTLSEGSCNAIIEAMACGLPIISSQGDFNDDILDESYAIRIDPKNILEIRQAIKSLITDQEKQNEMASSALSSSENFTLQSRFNRINSWMNSRENFLGD